MTNYKFSYDRKTDDLFLHHPKNKSEGSVELGDGNLILDFNKQGKPVGLQILNASDLFKEIMDLKKSEAENILDNLEKADVNFKKWKNNTLLVRFAFKYRIDEETKEMSSSMLSTEPRMESPALATS